ncbi:CNBP [Mytilus coruscus]|uniref:CNBP n=1 Tax=Mytilus coruscus TaxID=42192 RepID=A0A6J8DJF5_MYTCO|nr:CNBP [Mytilus coruscus]
MKLMRENPATFALGVKSAMTEHNLRKRFTLRTERVDEPRYKTTRPMTLNRPRRTEPLNSHEPMEIDHYRDAKRCYSCGKVGHVSRNCRSEGNFRQINAVEMQTYHGNSGRNKEMNCYSCGRIGHIARDCRSRGTYRQVNAVETKPYQGNSGRNNEIICYQCNQRGHIRPNCPNRKPRTVNMVENWGVYQEN